MRKVLKRNLSLLLAITLIFSSAVVGLNEVDFAGFFTVRAKAASSGNCGNNVKWSLSDDGVLTISGSGAMWDYNIWGDDTTAFHPPFVSSEIRKIIISSGVTRIGNDTFMGCENLTSITIPVSITSVGRSAFSYCTNLNITYFEGTKYQWNNIYISYYNDALLKNIVYEYKEPEVYGFAPETPWVKAVNAVKGVAVSWNKVDNAIKYNVYCRRQCTSTWIYLGTTTNTTFVDKTACPTVSYEYSVRAYDANGLYSDYDYTKTAKILCVDTPTVIATNTINGIQIKWNAVLSTYYKIYRRVGGSSSWSLIGTTTNPTFNDTMKTPNFIDNDVKTGTYYIYSVRAVNTYYPSIYESHDYISAFDTKKTDTIQPVTAPTAVATNLTTGVQVKWNASAGATKYNVYRRIGGSSSWVLVGTTTGTSLIDKGVTNGEYYVYSIRAINGTGYSAFDTKKTDTIQPITAPTAKVAKKSTGVQVSWNKVTGATKYNIYRRLGGTSTWVYVGTTTNTTLLDKGVVKGKLYAYSIRAINGTGYSAYNSSKCASIKYS